MSFVLHMMCTTFINDENVKLTHSPRKCNMESDLSKVPSPSPCCQERLCSEMSTTSAKTCLSGAALFASALPTVGSLACSLTPFLLTGYRMDSLYFAGGKCLTQNRNSMVSKPYGVVVYFTDHKSQNIGRNMLSLSSFL